MDTIAAIATPSGLGGVGIIKVSGPFALAIAASIFRRPGGGHLEKSFESHRVYYGYIADNDRMIDEALLVVMKSPHSYTREDVIEIQAHSSPAALSSILDLVLQKGARMAEPGEFTKRAFLNGRIDLTQAEAVIDIIQAKSARALEIAAYQLKGRLSQQIYSIRDALTAVIAEIEAAVDFPEDTDETFDSEKIAAHLRSQVLCPLTHLVNQYQQGRWQKEGIRAAIVGKPNVGKSSLLNCLLQKDRAIVTPFPGTTRDTLEEMTIMHGIPTILIDTAGLHHAVDPVEKIGIQKAYDAMQTADVILFMVEANRPLTQEDYAIYHQIGDKPLIILKNKIDLMDASSNCQLPDSWSYASLASISALCRTGIEDLEKAITDVVRGSFSDTDHPLITSIRHKQILEKSLQTAYSAYDGVVSVNPPYDLIADDLWTSVKALGEIIGTTTPEDILDQIFSQFCIGK